MFYNIFGKEIGHKNTEGSKYMIKEWTLYKIADNGRYAPRGSNPDGCTETNFYSSCNPLHPYIRMLVSSDISKPDDISKIKLVHWTHIMEEKEV